MNGLFILLQQAPENSKPFGGFWDKLQSWWGQIGDKLPEIILAFVSLFLFYFVSRLLGLLLERILPRVSKNQAVNRLLISINSIVILILGVFAALAILDLDKTVTSLLAGVGIIGLALGFAFQTAAQNILSGIIMAVQSPINVGDIIESNKHFGEVKHIGLRATRVTNPYGQEVEIPNRLVLQEPFEHYTYHGVRRVDVECRVPFDEDLERVREIVTKAVRERVKEVLTDRRVDLFFMEFGDYAVEFELRCWVHYSGNITDYFEGQSEVIIAVRRALEEAGIRIPIPPRAVHFPDGRSDGQDEDSSAAS